MSNAVASLIATDRVVLNLTYQCDRGLALLDDYGLARVAELVNSLDGIRASRRALVDSAEASQIGSLRLNPNARNQINAEYDQQVEELASIINTRPYRKTGAGSINGRAVR